MAAGQGSRQAAAALDMTLASLDEGLRAISVLLHPYMPASHRAAARRARRRRSLEFAGAAFAQRAAAAAPVTAARAAVPQAGVIDSHTHLDACEPPIAELVAAADAAGVTRIVTVGTDGASCRAALAAAEDFPQVYAAIGRHPNESTGFDDADFAELEALGQPRAVRRDRRDRASTTTATTRRARISGARSRPRSSSRAATGKPLVIHTRAADDDTLAMLDAHADGLRVILHCFSMAEPRARSASPTTSGGSRSPATRPTPRLEDLRDAALRKSRRPAAGRDRRAVSLAPARARQAQPAGQRRRRPRRRSRSTRRVAYDELERAIEASAAAVFGW